MPTQHLFHADSFLRSFRAAVVDRRVIDGRPAVALDNTAFYPTSGGQPNDTGRLDTTTVIDVRDTGRDGVIWHVLEGPLADDALVVGEIDWARRWDHMQNHSGQHVLSQAFILTAKAETVAWHLSPQSSTAGAKSAVTIDLDRVDLSEDDLTRAELFANQIVQEDRPISARLVAEADLPALALRKQPDITGPLRIVEIADFDRVACSGTHVASTAQIGLIKVLRAERQGKETRVTFVCGGRALADYRRKHQLVRALAAQFTRSEEELLDAVAKLQQEADSNFKALRSAQDALVNAEADRLWAAAASQHAPRLISGLYDAWPADQVKRLALGLRSRPGCFIALAGGNPLQVFFGRSDDLALDAGQTLRTALAAAGGRGGGRAEFAQGSVPSPEAAAQVLAQANAIAQTLN
jgi:alanyl-tRNA synthetase